MMVVVYQWCCYVIEENECLYQVLYLLMNGEMEVFGELLFCIYEGLSKEYEVSCCEFDFLVELVKDYEGVVGVCMMGGGFGGCIFNLVKKLVKEDFLKYVKKEYYWAFFVQVEYYEFEIVDGIDIVRG